MLLEIETCEDFIECIVLFNLHYVDVVSNIQIYTNYHVVEFYILFFLQACTQSLSFSE